MVFAGSTGDFDDLTKENREWMTIQPFKNFKGDQALCQVTLFDGGHNSYMRRKYAAEKIPGQHIPDCCFFKF